MRERWKDNKGDGRGGGMGFEIEERNLLKELHQRKK